MSSSSSVPPNGGPLTTIFTPPPGCFEKPPDTWSFCDTLSASSSSSSTSSSSSSSSSAADSASWLCYWSVNPSCYPTGASTETVFYPYYTIRSSSSSSSSSPSPSSSTSSFGSGFPYKLHYSPAVMPSGFTTFQTYGGSTIGLGCLEGWTIASTYHGFCNSQVAGTYIGRSGITSGFFTAQLPHIQASWHTYDLELFTPLSAPVLPYSRITKYEASVAASRSMTGNVTSDTNGNGLSTGGKIGIGVGIGVVVLVLLGFLLVILRRRHKRRARAESPRREISSLYEPVNQMSQEGEGTEDKPELRMSRSPEPPPVPLASKPRGVPRIGPHELHGEFHGSEVWE